MNQPITIDQDEWLRVLGKGMITLPKKWRDDLGISEGDIVRAKKNGKQMVIETAKAITAPYRIYSDTEIDKFVEDDRLPPRLKAKIDKKIAALKNA